MVSCTLAMKIKFILFNFIRIKLSNILKIKFINQLVCNQNYKLLSLIALSCKIKKKFKIIISKMVIFYPCPKNLNLNHLFLISHKLFTPKNKTLKKEEAQNVLLKSIYHHQIFQKQI